MITSSMRNNTHERFELRSARRAYRSARPNFTLSAMIATQLLLGGVLGCNTTCPLTLDDDGVFSADEQTQIRELLESGASDIESILGIVECLSSVGIEFPAPLPTLEGATANDRDSFEIELSAYSHRDENRLRTPANAETSSAAWIAPRDNRIMVESANPYL